VFLFIASLAGFFCSNATNVIIGAKDHASVQINVAKVCSLACRQHRFDLTTNI
jgi:hypothetical protein